MKQPVVAIHQPAYLPWFGLLEKIALADRFIVLDSVQYNARAYQHRTLYSTSDGPRYLSLSVSSKGHQVNRTEIRDIALVDAAVPGRHYETLRHRYGKRPGWPRLEADLERILTAPPEMLIDLNVALLRLTLRQFGITTEIVMASQLEQAGTKGDLMLSLVHAAGGGTYLSGSGAATYMDAAVFDAGGVDVAWQAFEHPIYPQSHRGEFQPGCFALEWIIEEPEDAARKFREHVGAAAERIGLTR